MDSPTIYLFHKYKQYATHETRVRPFFEPMSTPPPFQDNDLNDILEIYTDHHDNPSPFLKTSSYTGRSLYQSSSTIYSYNQGHHHKIYPVFLTLLLLLLSNFLVLCVRRSTYHKLILTQYVIKCIETLTNEDRNGFDTAIKDELAFFSKKLCPTNPDGQHN